MTFLSAVSFGVLGAVFSLGLWGLSHKPHWHELVYLMQGIPPAFAGLGAIVGAGFAGFTAWRGLNPLRSGSTRAAIVTWSVMGAVTGMVGEVFISLLRGLPLRMSIHPMLLVMPAVIMGTLGALVGTGVIAIARRGKEVTSGETAVHGEELLSPPTG